MSPAQTPDINRIAAAVARELATESDPAPVINFGDIAAGSLTGSVDIEILIGTATYTLTVQMPTAANKNEYVFKLTMKSGEGTPIEIASFRYKADGSGWEIKAGLPEITISPNFKILKAQLALGSGTI
jgi:hypothetical protein